MTGIAATDDPKATIDGAELAPPTLQDVFLARNVVDRYLEPTPLLYSEALSQKLGFDLWLKCENLQPIGAFKIRGGIYLISKLPEAQKARGVVSASTGNHGQSIAYAARLFGTRAVICVPEQANPIKVASMERLGAEVVKAGRDFDDARLNAERLQRDEGLSYIHSANEPDLIAGVGTYSLEIIEKVPDLDALVVPIGAGSGACGAVIAAKGVSPSLRVIGAQAAGAPAFHDSWQRNELLSYETMDTFAEGMATRQAFSLPLRILREGLDSIVLISDSDLRRSILTLLEQARVLAEGAGAAAFAAAHNLKEELAGKKVAVVVSGGNLEAGMLARALDEEQAW
ncbi:MAG: threonine/serine dehydratase [Thermomicrobiales bacterium]|nr:threonine/serine dehydratase [Thermomicrobiales bacterium]MCO5220517.1 threonine/serine dehydratase [Thermomicrobiales bacterium]